ncbi:hypothetical protein ASPZODRAFT_148884 [Penicilliopsis zonata CBS 506.65]|uniref:ferric-chelate reductase (NADPH) n=1 Tax=Penicilliopsis zonata CBS 506.65 TaxID=1073090 RepID=A0A1L9SWU9_9EURO|nr:hypothetical protein ASPZODRAFT_148884 [Penicilliopsis zonata CBS 506.65]OJJ51636.1 hypothetical protein ASPZODRAFT_148884 [Penicilliopsis zonata CBS 506.65]
MAVAQEQLDNGLDKRGGTSESFYEMLNDDLARITLLSLGCLVAAVYVWKLSLHFSDHLRRLASFSNDKQRYFLSPNRTWANIKEHIIYAPLFRVRHNREFKLSRAVNMGTLPSRFHTLLLLGILAMNVTLCVVTVPYHSEESTTAGIIRNRTGTMSVVNMIPLILLGGRNNPLIPLLCISFDTYNLLHRWLGRIVVLQALAHVIACLIPDIQEKGWSAEWAHVFSDNFLLVGFISCVAFVAIVVQSPSALRHAFYETFLHLHIVLAVVACAFLWIHLDGFVSQAYLLVALVFWGFSWTARLVILAYRNFGNGSTTALVEALPGDCLRVTIRMARPWKYRPGQHLYLYIPSVGWWMSHPFSVGWSETEEITIDGKGIPMTHQDVLASRKTTVSLLVRRCTGFTDKLFQRAQNNIGSRVVLRAMVEGPYGSIHSMDSYGSCMLFAGGVGVTHLIPFVQHLVRGYAEGTVAARRVTLVWIIQSPEHLEWIRPWMTSILGMERRREVLRIMLFITRPRSTKEIQSPSTTVQMFPGRPNIDTLIGMEVENQIGAMGVLVCGNGGLSDDIRRVCRQRQGRTTIDFIEESFTW